MYPSYGGQSHVDLSRGRNCPGLLRALHKSRTEQVLFILSDSFCQKEALFVTTMTRGSGYTYTTLNVGRETRLRSVRLRRLGGKTEPFGVKQIWAQLLVLSIAS
jgi:hypothetical protein